MVTGKYSEGSNRLPEGTAFRVSKPATQLAIGTGGGVICTIHADGRFEKGPGFTTLDEASRIFWDYIASKQPAPRVAGWQPIETAPRDGTQFLAFLNNGWHTLLRFPRHSDRGYPYQYWQVTGEIPPIVDTHPKDTDWEETSTILATHWMPLPNPPGAE